MLETSMTITSEGAVRKRASTKDILGATWTSIKTSPTAVQASSLKGLLFKGRKINLRLTPKWTSKLPEHNGVIDLPKNFMPI